MLIINQNFPEILTSKCICSVLGGKPLGSVFCLLCLSDEVELLWF